MGRRHQDACPGSTPYSSRPQRRLTPHLPPYVPDATCLRSFSPGSRWSSCSSSGSARRAAGTAAPPPSRPSTSPRRGAIWPARRRRWPRCTTSPRSCSAAAARPSASASPSSRATPSWSTSGRPGARPCRTEFPIFQSESVAKGKKVAFLGLNAGDSSAPARKFLRASPLPFPSYVDPEEDIAKSIQAPANYPITIFFDARGKLVYAHQGGYRKQADLAADLKRYLKQ